MVQPFCTNTRKFAYNQFKTLLWLSTVNLSNLPTKVKQKNKLKKSLFYSISLSFFGVEISIWWWVFLELLRIIRTSISSHTFPLPSSGSNTHLSFAFRLLAIRKLGQPVVIAPRPLDQREIFTDHSLLFWQRSNAFFLNLISLISPLGMAWDHKKKVLYQTQYSNEDLLCSQLENQHLPSY